MPIIFKGHNEEENPVDLVATHQRLLIAAAMRTTGPILELGVGWYSTPLLHEIAEAQQRLLITIDNNNDWLTQFKPLQSKWHALRLVGCWNELIAVLQSEYTQAISDIQFGFCFVDQGQPCEREYAIKNLDELGIVDVFVMHDTEEAFAYGYRRILGDAHFQDNGIVLPTALDTSHKHTGKFEYQYTDKSQKAWTTLASNTVDFSKWGLVDLPPVEPTQEIT